MASAPITLDGTNGGGQLLRSALALSLATGRGLLIEHLCVRSPEPGLTASQLACVRAAQAVCGASLEGAEQGSQRLAFQPGPISPGHYLLDLGACAPATHALQTVAVGLSLAGGGSTLLLRGGTHLAGAPTLHYLTHLWLPAMKQLGFRIGVELSKAGFAPEGGGEIRASIGAAEPAVALEARSRGTLREVRVLSTVSNVPFEVGVSQGERVLARLREHGICAEAENLPVPAPKSKGTMCCVVGSFERVRAGFCAVGGADSRPEQIGDEAADGFVDYIRGRGALDPYLADQLVVPLAVGAAGLQGGTRPISRFTTRITENLEINAALAARFLDVEVAVLAAAGADGEVRVAPREASLLEAIRRGNETRREP